MWKYKGHGEMVSASDGSWVPPRNLTDDEYKHYKADIAKNAKLYGVSLYEEGKPDAAPTQSSDASSPDGGN